MRTYAVILGILAFAFFLRVLGQVLVAFFGADFLPPMDEWQSGLIPYPWLLASQILILAVQGWICWDLWRGAGFFARRRSRTGRILCWFSLVYFAAMAARYIIIMALYPERRWFTGTIPIFFHWVLAAYLFVLGQFYLRAGATASAGCNTD